MSGSSKLINLALIVAQFLTLHFPFSQNLIASCYFSYETHNKNQQFSSRLSSALFWVLSPNLSIFHWYSLYLSCVFLIFSPGKNHIQWSMLEECYVLLLGFVCLFCIFTHTQMFVCVYFHIFVLKKSRSRKYALHLEKKTVSLVKVFDDPYFKQPSKTLVLCLGECGRAPSGAYYFNGLSRQ